MDAPENTIAAVEEAARRGARWLETDVRLTADGGLVIFHDETLDRTTTGTGHVARTTLTEIQALDAGSWFAPEFKGERVPDLPEFLQAILDCGLCLQLEFKENPGREEALVEGVAAVLIDQWPLGERGLLLSSFSEHCLHLASEALPEVPRAFATEFVPIDPVARLKRTGSQILHIQEAVASEAELQILSDAQIEFAVATVNDADRARFFLDHGATSVLSDIPDLLS